MDKRISKFESIRSKSKEYAKKEYIKSFTRLDKVNLECYKSKRKWRKLLSDFDFEFFSDVIRYVSTFFKNTSNKEFIDNLLFFADYYDNYIDPRFNNSDKITITNDKDGKGIIINTDKFSFQVSWEITSIPKTKGYSLFDSIVGLDKADDNLVFVKVDIVNPISGVKYSVNYTKGEEDITFESSLYEEQWEFCKEKVIEVIDDCLLNHIFEDNRRKYIDIINIIKECKKSKRLRGVFDEWQGLSILDDPEQ